MSNSTTSLDLISQSQAQKEVTANALFDAASPAVLYGRRASTTAALTWGYYGGNISVSGTVTAIPNGTVTIAASAANYVEANPTTGAVTANTAGFTVGKTPLYTVVTGASTVTNYTDQRVLGTSGAGGAQPFDVTTFYPGVPTASAKLLCVPVARAVTFPSNFAGSYAKAGAAATASTAFDVQKNGTSVGTITFAAAASVGTFVTAAVVTLAAGDVLAIIAPSTADTSLADVGIVLAGTR